MSDNSEKNKINQKKATIGYAIGSVVLFAAACVVIPLLMSKATAVLYKASISTAKDGDEDWGPAIERKDEG